MLSNVKQRDGKRIRFQLRIPFINVQEYRIKDVYAFSPFESCAFVTLRKGSRIEPLLSI